MVNDKLYYSKQLSQKLKHSKRLNSLKKAINKIKYRGIWDLKVSTLYKDSLVITGDGLSLIYLKPETGLFWFRIIGINPSNNSYPFCSLLNQDKPVSLPDVIKALSY